MLTMFPHSIFETHYKSKIVMGSFYVTTIGWFAWLCFLDGVFGATPSGPYVIRNSFTGLFGNDPAWWATLFGVLGMLGLFEMTLKTAKRNLQVIGVWQWPPWQKPGLSENVEDWDLELWQELEQNPVVKEKLAKMAKEDDLDEEEKDEDELLVEVLEDEPIELGVKGEEEKPKARAHFDALISRFRNMIPH